MTRSIRFATVGDLAGPSRRRCATCRRRFRPLTQPSDGQPGRAQDADVRRGRSGTPSPKHDPAEQEARPRLAVDRGQSGRVSARRRLNAAARASTSRGFYENLEAARQVLDLTLRPQAQLCGSRPRPSSAVYHLETQQAPVPSAFGVARPAPDTRSRRALSHDSGF